MFPMPKNDEIKGSQQSGEGGVPPTNNGFNKSVLQVVHTVDGSEIPNNRRLDVFSTLVNNGIATTNLNC